MQQSGVFLSIALVAVVLCGSAAFSSARLLNLPHAESAEELLELLHANSTSRDAAQLPPATPSAASAGAAAAAGGVVTFFENFTGPVLNESLWNVRNNMSHCSPCEPELYMADEVYIEDGNLVLRTRARHMIGPHGEKYNYTSGWVDTKANWFHAFGLFEVHAALPSRKHSGIWPAHWLMPNPATSDPKDVCWPVGGEIDIMEYTANPLMNSIAGSLRWGNKCGDNKQIAPGSLFPSVFNDTVDWTQYHTFAVEWAPTYIKWLLDGVVYHTRTSTQVNVPQDPFYWILDSAIAWYWMPTGSAFAEPAYHRIDWMRVTTLPSVTESQ